MLKLWVVALGLSGLLPLASASQGPGVETPSKASVFVKSPPRLVPGQNFEFLLKFDPPPHGYVDGQIHYKFQLTSPIGSEAHPEGNLQMLDRSTKLINDVPDYPLKLRVIPSMLPGTWKLTEVTIVGGISHPIHVPENVTFEVYEPTSPIRAKVIWSKSQRLEDGESFDFSVRLETTPAGYDPGGIRYRFQLKKPDQQDNPSVSVEHLSSVEGSMGLDIGGSTYRALVPINRYAGRSDNSFMSLGEWKLVELSVAGRPVLFQDDVTFEVRAPSIILRVQAPSSVRAGQSFDLKVSVDGYLQNSFCTPTLSLDLRQRPREGHPGPNDLHLSTRSISLNPEQQQHPYEISVPFAPDLPGGPWQGEFTVTNGLTNSMFNHAPPEFCRSPNLDGDTRFVFEVEPAVGLVTPTSANVIINPSQAQLLLVKADGLKAMAESLRSQLGSDNSAANRVLLQKGLQDAIIDLVATETAYKAGGVDQSSARVVDEFFESIRRNYDGARKVLANDLANVRGPGPRLARVSAFSEDSAPMKVSGSEAVLGSILHAANAYYGVASTKLMTFTLRVVTHPDGASISYRILGDPSYKTCPRLTDSKIDGLTKAIYEIRLEKSGYAKWEGTYDATTETEALDEALVKRRPGAR